MERESSNDLRICTIAVREDVVEGVDPLFHLISGQGVQADTSRSTGHCGGYDTGDTIGIDSLDCYDEIIKLQTTNTFTLPTLMRTYG